MFKLGVDEKLDEFKKSFDLLEVDLDKGLNLLGTVTSNRIYEKLTNIGEGQLSSVLNFTKLSFRWDTNGPVFASATHA